MKPWQLMTLLSITAAIVAFGIGCFIPIIGFTADVVIGAVVAVVAVVVMRPKEN